MKFANRNNSIIPDNVALAHSNKLLELIRHEITQQGAISFARYMELALYAPGLGYYSAGTQKFGAAGDFLTAPEISALFSVCVAKQLRQILSALPNGDVLELGAGSGVMAADILQALERWHCLPQHYYILELSADLRQRQQQLFSKRIPHLLSKIIWLDNLENFTMQGVVVANEVLDAMPVHRFHWHKNLMEYYITLDKDGLAWHLDKPSAELMQAIAAMKITFPENYSSEINLALSGWIAAIAKILQRGLVLIIDYGFPRREYYHPDRNQGTLICHYRHQTNNNYLLWPGLQDITAHVDFTAVAEAAVANQLDVAGYTHQASFLLACGITDLVNNKTTEEHWRLSQQIKQLTLPSEMGELFKVIALSKALDLQLQGFQLLDMRMKL